MNAIYAQLTPKERKIQREASAKGMKDLILMLITQKISVSGDLNSVLADDMVQAMLSQVETNTGFSVRISVGENNLPVWHQIDLSEDTISSVRMKNRQVMRSQIAGVQIECLVAQYQDKDSILATYSRDDTVFALRRLASIIERFEDPVLNIHTLGDGKKHKWEISENGPIAFQSESDDADEPSEQSPEITDNPGAQNALEQADSESELQQ